MSITFSGLATGLDTNSIVDDIMALERAPITRVETQKTSETDKLKAYKQFDEKLDALKSAVSDMSITSQIRSTKVSLSSEDSYSATSDSGALGSYNISVAQLSQVQKTITDGFSSNTDSVLGTGSITVNGEVISVNEDNNSLVSIVQSINKLSETTGVTASLINDGTDTDPYHLVFTGKDANTAFTIETALEDASSDPITVVTTNAQEAQQAIAFIDGIKVVSDSNTITDAISGVTLNLNSVSETSYAGTAEVGVDPLDWVDPPVYTTDRMDVEADSGILKEKVTSFVTAYNDAMEWILSGYDEFGGAAAVDADSDEEVMLGSLLRGDSTINKVKRQLQSVLTNVVSNSGQYQILSEIGITTNLNGTLNQDNSKLDTALEENYDDMIYLLSGDDDTPGVMKDFNSVLLDITSSTQGMYASKKNAYTSLVKKFDTQIDQMELRMIKKESTLRSQFTMMEQLVSLLNAQGDFLTQQMDALNRD